MSGSENVNQTATDLFQSLYSNSTTGAMNQTALDSLTRSMKENDIQVNQTTVAALVEANNQTFTCYSKILPIPMQNASSWATDGCLKGFYCKKMRYFYESAHRH